jgi:hypothetical protein
MRFARGREGVSWEFFEAMAKAFHEWRALHPYADPRLLAKTLREQAEREAAERIAQIVPPLEAQPNKSKTAQAPSAADVRHNGGGTR